MRTILNIALAALTAFAVAKAQNLSGYVYESHDDEHAHPLEGANVYWMNTTTGDATDTAGHFELPRAEHAHMLVVSYIGYKPDTVHVGHDDDTISVTLSINRELEEVVVTSKRRGRYVSPDAIYTETLTSSEFTKAACCNLSESFETNASVDVAYADAVTGAKQIRLLGLAGRYTQMMNENIPAMRGLASPFGLSYVPGPWMESIQISKGAGSVVNGYESIAGTINVEYRKPDAAEPLYVNFYGNGFAKTDANAYAAQRIDERTSTMTFFHGEYFNGSLDQNDDRFVDMPATAQYNVFHRWRYSEPGALESQIGVKALGETRRGGSADFDFGTPRERLNEYGVEIETNRYETFAKLGFLFDTERPSSLGFQAAFDAHETRSFFGRNDYDADQATFYGNMIYERRTNDEDKLNFGASVLYDDLERVWNDSTMNRDEIVPGVFAQYTVSPIETLTFVLGARADFHNLYGTLLTPRLHAKYHVTEHVTLRGSAGKGYRTATPLAENTAILASSREVMRMEELDVEEAWNYGANLLVEFEIDGKPSSFAVEYYRTDFQNQIVVDRDADVYQIRLYNLRGESYANNAQVEFSTEPLRRLDATLAYRVIDVKTTIDGTLREAPLQSRYKGLFTLSYWTLSGWQFDFTSQLNGEGRLPENEGLPVEYRRDEEFPAFVSINAQVSKKFDVVEVYVGGENLTDFRQENPIVAADDPFGPHFDASQIWGPLVGRTIYAGARLTFD
ncbi:MAG: TonB-dependent receptor plug domain-containing protein [Ignavibacteriales bacterium]|nr:TonB-dependent receptor plug domain-containing protein [Ignavibacteriales bacterium]